jgi:hypothetical protein
LHPLGERNPTASVVSLAVRDLDHTVLMIRPLETKTLFRPDAAIQENDRDITEQKRVNRIEIEDIEARLSELERAAEASKQMTKAKYKC